MVFTTNQDVQLLATSDEWFHDGVFKVSPEIWFQQGTFEEFCDEVRNAYNADTVEILDYIEDSYIVWCRTNAPRRPPLFALEICTWHIKKCHESITTLKAGIADINLCVRHGILRFGNLREWFLYEHKSVLKNIAP